MDAETRRWLEALSTKLDRTLEGLADFRDRIVRLEEQRSQADVEHMRHRKRLEEHSLTLQDLNRGKAKIAGISAGIGAAIPVVGWLVSRLLGA